MALTDQGMPEVGSPEYFAMLEAIPAQMDAKTAANRERFAPIVAAAGLNPDTYDYANIQPEIFDKLGSNSARALQLSTMDYGNQSRVQDFEAYTNAAQKALSGNLSDAQMWSDYDQNAYKQSGFQNFMQGAIKTGLGAMIGAGIGDAAGLWNLGGAEAGIGVMPELGASTLPTSAELGGALTSGYTPLELAGIGSGTTGGMLTAAEAAALTDSIGASAAVPATIGDAAIAAATEAGLPYYTAAGLGGATITGGMLGGGAIGTLPALEASTLPPPMAPVTGVPPIIPEPITSGTGIGVMPPLPPSTLPAPSPPITSGVTPITPLPNPSTGSGLLGTIGSTVGSVLTNPNVLGPALTVGGGLLAGSAATDAAKIAADAQIKAAQIAADAAKFKPVGVTTNFGSSKFGFDANGNLINAGYELAPWLQAQQERLKYNSTGMLDQFASSTADTAPMTDAAKRAMELGQGYLKSSPQEHAAKYMAEQQALLAGGRATSYADMQNRLQQTGRAGLSVGGGGGMMAANPEMQAYYNAQRQQDLELAAKATQGGMDYAKFGAGMVGTGADLLNSRYNTQVNAFNPYKTALSGMQMQEGLGQNALQMGMDMGKTATAASAQSGLLMANGMNNAANTMQPANAYSPWGALLGGAGQALQNYKWGT